MLWCERKMCEVKPGGEQIQEGIDIPGNIVSAVRSNCAWIHYVWTFLYMIQQITIFECTIRIAFLYLQLNASSWKKKSVDSALFTMLSFKKEREKFSDNINGCSTVLWTLVSPSHSVSLSQLSLTHINIFCFLLWSTMINQLHILLYDSHFIYLW